VHDDARRKPRLLVLGDWTECDNYARLDDAGLIHHSATLSA
jgi:hypothetical protein